jgi:hypothetical protein
LHGLAIQLKGAESDILRGERIQEKMKSNMQRALDRIDELSNLIFYLNRKLNLFIIDANTNQKIERKCTAKTLNTTITKSAASSISPRQNISKQPQSFINQRTQSFTSSSAVATPSALANKVKTKLTIANSQPSSAGSLNSNNGSDDKIPLSKKLKIPNVEPRLVSFILDEIIDSGQNVKFADIGEVITSKSF